MAAKDLVRWERRVQKERDPQRRPGLSQYPGQQHELVIVDPDQVIVLGDLEDAGRELLVDLAILLPPLGLVAKPAGHVMQQGPEARVGKALVKRLDLAGIEKDRHVTELVPKRLFDVALLRLVIDRGAGPSNPPQRRAHRLQGRDQSHADDFSIFFSDRHRVASVRYVDHFGHYPIYASNPRERERVKPLVP